MEMEVSLQHCLGPRIAAASLDTFGWPISDHVARGSSPTGAGAPRTGPPRLANGRAINSNRC